MPAFNNDIRILKREIRNYNPERVPPLLSLLLTGVSFIIALIIGLFFIFPFLRATFHMKFYVAIFLSLGSFILIHFGIAELCHKLFIRLSQHEKEQTS